MPETHTAAYDRVPGIICLVAASLDLLLLAAGTLHWLPGARDSGAELWRWAMLVLGVQAGATILTGYALGARLLRQTAITRTWHTGLLALLAVQLVTVAFGIPVNVGIGGSYEYVKFVQYALWAQAAVTMLWISVAGTAMKRQGQNRTP